MREDVTSDFLTAISGHSFSPVLIGYLDIESDPIPMWTDVGTFAPSGTPDSILNGKFFSPLRSFADASDIKEDDGMGGPVTIRLRGGDLDEDAMRQFVRDKRRWLNRPAYLWLGLMNETLNAVLNYPIRIKTGIMASATLSRSKEGAAVEITIDEDLGGAKGAAFMIANHREVYPDDKFTSFMAQLANKPGGLERGTVVSQAPPPYENNPSDYGNW